MTAEQLIALSGAGLAILFAYVPGFANWFNPLEPTHKRLIMLGILVVLSVGIFGLSCAGVFSYVTCDQKGAVGLLMALVTAIVANQGTFAILPKAGLNTSVALKDKVQ